MTKDQAQVGTRIRSLVPFAGVPRGTEGVIDQDYGTGVMVAWDLPRSRLPVNYREYDGQWAVASRILRDGFDKETELHFLEVVEG